MRLSPKSVAVFAAAVLVIASGSAAYAAWNASGTGNGTAEATTAKALTVTEVDNGADLYPGASTSVSFKITNTNPYPVQVTNAVVSVDKVTSPASQCTKADVTAVGSVAVDSGVIEPGANSTVTVPSAISMVADANNDCQNATFDFVVAITGASAAQ